MAGFEIGMSRFYENAFCALHISIIPKADTTKLCSVSLSIPTLTHGVFRDGKIKALCSVREQSAGKARDRQRTMLAVPSLIVIAVP